MQACHRVAACRSDYRALSVADVSIAKNQLRSLQPCLWAGFVCSSFHSITSKIQRKRKINTTLLCHYNAGRSEKGGLYM
jgi:hypothetical protein